MGKLRAKDGALLGIFNVGIVPTKMAFDGANILGDKQRCEPSGNTPVIRA